MGAGADAAAAAGASFFFDEALLGSDAAEAPPVGGTAGTEDTATVSSVVILALDGTNDAPSHGEGYAGGSGGGIAIEGKRLMTCHQYAIPSPHFFEFCRKNGEAGA